jgi:hypothetical protein
MSSVKDRLKRNGRPEIQAFPPAERLYRRYRREDYVDNLFSNIGFRFPKQSVNRSAFSIPRDVLFSEAGEYEGWGVLSFGVRDLPRNFPSEDPEVDFFPKHQPLEINYAHTEIWCDDCSHPTGHYTEPTKRLKKLFRARLSQSVTKEIEAEL